MNDPLEDPLAWENDPTFTVVALLQHGKNSRTTVSTVKLAKTHALAAAEMDRMIDVTVKNLGPGSGGLLEQRTVKIDRGMSWAHVELSMGATYHFSIQKARWANPDEPAKVPSGCKHGCP